MISAAIPMTIPSTANSTLSIQEFIEYSIKNDLHIVRLKLINCLSFHLYLYLYLYLYFYFYFYIYIFRLQLNGWLIPVKLQ